MSPFEEVDRLPLVDAESQLRLEDDSNGEKRLEVSCRGDRINNNLCIISISHIVCLFITAFLLGAMVPFVCQKLTSPQIRTQESYVTVLEDTEKRVKINEMEEPRKENNTRPFTVDKSEDAPPYPKIAWLMAFPNSGTTYTMELIAAASKMTMATNYGQEQYRKGLHLAYPNWTTPLIPVFPGGPLWVQPLRTHPTNVVLTKTHCGGYCHDCPLSMSAETPHSFAMHCATANGVLEVKPNIIVPDPTRYVYDYVKVVDRAIHLIRDPLDNLVARFHYDAKKLLRQNNTLWAERYTFDRQGFANLCADTSSQKLKGVDRDPRIDQDVWDLIQDIPCHLDIFRYVQWHNLAFITTEEYLTVPKLIVHYEDYSYNWNATLDSIMDFLDMTDTGGSVSFMRGKSYHSYFSEDQIQRLQKAIKMLALPLTWKYLQRYF